MWKKLLTALIVFIVISCFTVTVFAGNTEGFTDAVSTYTGNSTNSDSKDMTQTELNSTDKQQTSSTIDTDKTNTTYANEEDEYNGPDAEFFTAIKQILKEGKAIDNGQTILYVTKPVAIDEKVSIYSNKFSVSVKTVFEDVVFSVARLNEATGRYEMIEFDGEKSIMVACGTETKEVNLEYGTNQLLLISYRSSEKVESKVQYNSILVEANRQSAADKAVSGNKTVKANNTNSFETLSQRFNTFIDNLIGKGK
jgi:hypothetical protein